MRLGLDRDDSGLGARVPAFHPLYRADDEAAFEIANATMHGVLHLGWVPDGNGGYRGQMAVLVKPNGCWATSTWQRSRHSAISSSTRACCAPWRDCGVKISGGRWLRRSTWLLTRAEHASHDRLRRLVTGRVGSPQIWPAERWARAILEGAPAGTRARLLAGWAALGLSVGADSGVHSGTVLGWPILRNTREAVLLGARSRIGMPGQLLVMIRPEGLLFATFLHHRTPATRSIWAAVQREHVDVVQDLRHRVAADVKADA